MSIDESSWVFDTGPLRHFAANQWLGVIKFLAGDRQVVIPESVERELQQTADKYLGAARQILDADWIHVDRSYDLRFLSAFANYEEALVAEGKNLGECGVLALGEIYKCEVIIDDATPRNIAETKGIRVTATVPLLCNAVRERKLTLAMVEELADSLLAGAYYLPFAPGEFRNYVLQEGLLDYDEPPPTS